MSRRAILVATVIGLMLTACGRSDSADSTIAPTTTLEQGKTTTTIPPTTTTTVPPPGVNTRYESIFDMREALEGGGFACTDWEVWGANEYAIESGLCRSDLVLGVYENATLIREQRDSRNGLLFTAYDKTYDLTGPNWNVTCTVDIDLCDQMLPLLGGEIIISAKP